MRTIDALEKDILLQIPFLLNFKPKNIISERRQKNSIFCGTGDSYVSALLAEAYSDLKVRAADPLDLLKNQQILKNTTVFPISISGNTISNIKIAKISKKSIAITANTQSKLATTCSELIALQYPSSGIFTAGSISFLASALTCISLVKSIHLQNTSHIFEKALKSCEKFKLCGKIFFLGNLHTYPIAMYAAAKFYEILGIDAHYERIEQFSHMGLFSTQKNDLVIIFEEKTKHNLQLEKNLKKIGIKTIRPDFQTKNKISQMIFFTFISQLLPLFLAKKNNQKDCYFVTAKNIRNASSSMIY